MAACGAVSSHVWFCLIKKVLSLIFYNLATKVFQDATPLTTSDSIIHRKPQCLTKFLRRSHVLSCCSGYIFVACLQRLAGSQLVAV